MTVWFASVAATRIVAAHHFTFQLYFSPQKQLRTSLAISLSLFTFKGLCNINVIFIFFNFNLFMALSLINKQMVLWSLVWVWGGLKNAIAKCTLKWISHILLPRYNGKTRFVYVTTVSDHTQKLINMIFE